MATVPVNVGSRDGQECLSRQSMDAVGGVTTTKTPRQPRPGVLSHVKLHGWHSVEGTMSGGSSSINFDADLAFLLSASRNG